MTEIAEHETQARNSRTLFSARADSSQTHRRTTWIVYWWRRCCGVLGQAIIILLLLSALIELTARVVWWIHPVTRQAELENQIGSPVYAGVDWAKEFWREETSRRQQPKVYVPFRVWGVTNWHSKYINNDAGVRGFVRRTINPGNCDPTHKVSIWTFGGSTMYGTAVPDSATIPSYLSRDLNAESAKCVVVSNLGVEGYVTDQEIILLAEQLKAGGHPDIVIFYDGVNDSSLAWPPTVPPDAHFSFRSVQARVEGSISARLDFVQKSYAMRFVTKGLADLHRSTSFAAMVPKAEPAILTVLNNYDANIRLAHALSSTYNFKLYCFWQPMLTYGNKPLVPFEKAMAVRDVTGTSAESAWFLIMNQAYDEEKQRSAKSGDVVFLAGLFDSISEPLYVDEAHLGPRGNELVAQAIAAYIRKDLQSNEQLHN